ncbi:MAG: RNA 2',3'-cyclic phosphodiesterase [Acidobacteriia bacterium]|nr:RNA 2',3'-cyclic phosphodiesterase [Terriglobia bacterium]
MRLFLAVDPDDEARRAIAAEQKRLLSALGDAADQIRPVRPEHMHMTLVFLGDVDDSRVAAVVDACGRPIDARPFDMAFAGVGVFPPRGAPRALWIGVDAGASELTAVQQEMAARVGRLGFAEEGGAFRPHLTLGRWRRSRPSDRGRVLAQASHTPAARCRVDRVTLYRSELPSAPHAGPTYTALAHANLTRGPSPTGPPAPGRATVT